MFDLNGFSFLLAGILIPLVLFLVGREIVLWYFKINEVVTLLREIRDRLPQPSTAPRPAQPSSLAQTTNRPRPEFADTGR